jgi:hypothetical protein
LKSKKGYQVSDSVSKDGGDNKVTFTATMPPHVNRNSNSVGKPVAGHPVAIPPNPDGNAFVPGKRGPN